MNRTALESIQERLVLSPFGVNTWILKESFIYYKWIKWSDDFIEIPKWFIFDWASIPRIFYVIGTPMSTDTLVAALVHDYIYKELMFTREQCDNLFNEIMEIMDVNDIKKALYYLWVRIWWWVAYNNYKKSCKK